MAQEIQVTPEKLREIKTTCDRQGESVDTVMTTVRGSIDQSGWESPAAQAFKNDWRDKFEPALKDLKMALEKLGEAARTMAQNYEETEKTYKGAG